MKKILKLLWQEDKYLIDTDYESGYIYCPWCGKKYNYSPRIGNKERRFLKSHQSKKHPEKLFKI